MEGTDNSHITYMMIRYHHIVADLILLLVTAAHLLLGQFFKLNFSMDRSVQERHSTYRMWFDLWIQAHTEDPGTHSQRGGGLLQ